MRLLGLHGRVSWFCMALLVAMSGTAFGAEKDTTDLSTPRKAVVNHLLYLQKDNRYNPAQSAKSLRIKDESQERAEALARHLKLILDGKGLEVDPADIPDEPDYVDSTSRKARYTLFGQLPEVYLVRVKDKWLYSRSTIEAIPEILADVYPFGMHNLVKIIPNSLRGSFLGLEVWQYFGIVILALLALMVHQLMSWILRVFIIQGINRLQKGQRYGANRFIRKVARPISWALLTIFIQKFVPALLLPLGMNEFIIIALKILTPAFITIALYNAVDMLSQVFENLAKKTEGNLDDQLVPLVRKSLKGIVVVIGIFYVLNSMDVNFWPYLAGLSIGGIAIAFAAQDSVKNVLGSFMIFVDRPFQIGDWINYNGTDGTVEEVGFRSTRMRTFYNSVVSIPNGKLADSMVDNYGLRVYRRFFTKIAVTYDTPPELMQAFVNGLREIVKEHPTTRKDYYEVHLNDLGSHSIDILFYIFFQVPTWSEELKGRHEVLMGIIELAQKLGIRFAFPTQTLHVEAFPEKASSTPKYEIHPEQFNAQVAEYIRQYAARHGKQPEA